MRHQRRRTGRGPVLKARPASTRDLGSFGLNSVRISVIVLFGVYGCGSTGSDISFIGPAAGSASVMTTDSMQVKADGIAAAKITIEVRDNNRNTLRFGGDDVALATTRGVLSAVTNPNNSGLYYAVLKSAEAGIAVVTGSVNGQRITTGDVQVTFVP